MSRCYTLSIVSDIHYAGAAERERRNYSLGCIAHPFQRLVIRLYRKHIWLRDPFAHNHLLDQFLTQTRGADYTVANGDYSCDSAFVGVADDAACASARECLERMREQCGPNFQATFGDHELGKKPMGADLGGLRVASFHRATAELGLQPFWQVTLGKYVLIGLVSTLAAWPVYGSEALPSEQEEWQDLRRVHLEAIRRAFAGLEPSQRVLLFCHDPTALPFLWREDAIRHKLPQVERTIIGHLHSPLILWKSRRLAGIPAVHFLGHTAKRLSSALREARHWKSFNVLLCPALAGIELLKDGGFCTAELDPAARTPARFEFHRLKR